MYHSKLLVLILVIILLIVLGGTWYVFTHRSALPLDQSQLLTQDKSTSSSTIKNTKMKNKAPKNVIGNLPAAKYDATKFTPKDLWGYQNPTALLTAVHQKTLKILSEAKNLNPHVLQLALRSYACAHIQSIGKPQYITIIDYSLPSSDKRMWVIDLKNAKVDFHTLVAHGKNSGSIDSTKFSNIPESKETSLGLFLTQGTYIGHNGYSLRLSGLEPAFNGNAMERDVVIHGAAYVNEDFVKKYHRIGRSWGCPALSKTVSTPVINTIKDGTLVFSYYPSEKWLTDSTFINCSASLPWEW